MSSYIHFHPELTLEGLEDSTWHIQGGRSSLWLTAFGHESHSLVRGQMDPSLQGWYSEHFGELKPNTVLALQTRKDLPVRFGYVISRENALKVESVQTSVECKITLADGKRTHILWLPKNEAPRIVEETDPLTFAQSGNFAVDVEPALE